MEQHAIPQQISSYEFKLVGDMTLKQFLKAAVGIVVAILINASDLIFFLKYPLMLLFGAGGLMIAFVPFQDRPLETWIIAFLRSIYSPTIYTYKKMADSDWINLMSTKPVGDKNKTTAEEEEEESSKPIKNQDRVREFIESLPTVQAANRQEEKERNEETLTIKKTIENKVETINESTPVMGEKTETKNDWREMKSDLNLQQSERLGATAKATFGQIPMPDKPEIPNIVVGMVTNLDDKIIDGAIVEIQDEKGNPARVLKTNSLGQFKTTAPLANGKYLIITEKDGWQFDRIEVELKNEIVEPLKIKAKI